MRSKRLDLDGVAARFQSWRRIKSPRQPIPADLLKAAVRLLGRHSTTAICRRLRLDHARFNRAQAGLMGVPGSEQARNQRAAGLRHLKRAQGALSPKTAPGVSSVNPGDGPFVQLPPLRGLSSLLSPPGHGIVGDSARYRLVLESATGTLSVVTTASGQGLVEAVCRFVLGALEGSSRA